jgi:uncharacterized membrane protein (DUF373 family)
MKAFLTGFFIGLLIPVIAFYFYTTLVLQVDFIPGLKQLWHENLITQVIAINVLANLLPVFVYYNRQETEKLRGVIGASVLYAFVISILYFV